MSELARGQGPDPGPFFDLTAEPLAIVSQDGRWRRVNQAFERMFGWREEELRDQAVARLAHPDDHALLGRSLAGEESGEIEVHLLTADGSYLGSCWHFTSRGDVHLAVGRPIPDRNQERFLMQIRHLRGEIEHRVRNTLAVIRSVIRRMAETTRDSETFAHLQGRIDAYSRVQAKFRFAGERERGIDLALLIEDELLAQSIREGEQLSVAGPDIALSAKAAEALTLAVHELAVNAVKFGAFSASDGRTDVRWTIEGEDGGTLRFEWRERGVTLDDVAEPRQGIGMETLLHSLPYDLGAQTRIDFLPQGVSFTLSVPLGRILAPSLRA